MFYRDFMQKYRPVYSPDEPAAPAAGADVAAAAAGDGQAAPAASAGPSAEPAAAAPAGDVVAEGAAAPAAGDAPKGEPTLLDGATGTKPEAKADAATDKDSPAPAEAAKTDAKADDVKPEAKDDKSAADADKPKAEDVKDAAKDDPAKKDATAAEPPAPIKYEAFKVPEGIKLDDERIGKFAEVAGAGQVSQDVAQSLLELHVAEMQRFSEEVVKQAEEHQRDVWSKLNDTWKTEARNDEQIGGNRLETALARGKAVLEEYGGTADQVRELIAHTSNNGMGNFPGFLRFLDNVAQALNVFEDSAVGANPNPPKPAKGPGQRGWYPSMGNGQQQT
ncbi:hypothetical protein [Bradyrhizobium sp. RT9a]|uniref:hypothetical protein n=1 Tax=Bradyrhizobium sp. RT9a TaxID=3156384 RepID=UPI003397184B